MQVFRASFQRLHGLGMSEGSSLLAALTTVRENIQKAHQQYCELNETKSSEPKLVAVGKGKPVELIEEAYKYGQRHFGENYVQELVQKANHFQNGHHDDIRWHFIGHLQTNKVNNLIGAPNLYAIETVDRKKLADAINKSWKENSAGHKLKVFAQVNTSGEESKSGCSPAECSNLVGHIIHNCDQLEFIGLMTIGSFNHDYSKGPNPDFVCLIRCRDEICETFQLTKEKIQISMGMSVDYQEAILAGSTNVRVGSTIFGARDESRRSRSRSRSSAG